MAAVCFYLTGTACLYCTILSVSVRGIWRSNQIKNRLSFWGPLAHQGNEDPRQIAKVATVSDNIFKVMTLNDSYDEGGQTAAGRGPTLMVSVSGDCEGERKVTKHTAGMNFVVADGATGLVYASLPLAGSDEVSIHLGNVFFAWCCVLHSRWLRICINHCRQDHA